MYRDDLFNTLKKKKTCDRVVWVLSNYLIIYLQI